MISEKPYVLLLPLLLPLLLLIIIMIMIVIIVNYSYFWGVLRWCLSAPKRAEDHK